MLTLVSTVYAQVDIGVKYGALFGRSIRFSGIVDLILGTGIALAGIIILFTFIFAGIKIIGGAGSNDPKAAAQGKQALTYAVIGFIVVFTTYWIIRIVEFITGSTFLTNPLG